jgi:hypothetical protein
LPESPKTSQDFAEIIKMLSEDENSPQKCNFSLSSGDSKSSDVHETKMDSNSEKFDNYQKTDTSIASDTTTTENSKNGEIKQENSDFDRINSAERLRIFFQLHNPEKIPAIPDILEKYKHREADLFTKLQKQYKTSKI